jgi:hypothetical protein
LKTIISGNWSIEESNASDKQWKMTLKEKEIKDENGNPKGVLVTITPVELELLDASNLMDIINENEVQFKPIEYTAKDINAKSINDTFTDNSSENPNLTPNFTLIPAIFSINYNKLTGKIGICDTRYSNVAHQLDNFVYKDEEILKIEVSTNDSNERLITWFDSQWVLNDEFDELPIYNACQSNMYQQLITIPHSSDNDKNLQVIVNY